MLAIDNRRPRVEDWKIVSNRDFRKIPRDPKVGFVKDYQKDTTQFVLFKPYIEDMTYNIQGDTYEVPIWHIEKFGMLFVSEEMKKDFFSQLRGHQSMRSETILRPKIRIEGEEEWREIERRKLEILAIHEDIVEMKIKRDRENRLENWRVLESNEVPYTDWKWEKNRLTVPYLNKKGVKKWVTPIQAKYYFKMKKIVIESVKPVEEVIKDI